MEDSTFAIPFLPGFGYPLTAKALNLSQRMWMTLTKADIAQKIADDCGLMKIEAAEILEKFLGVIKRRFVAGDDVMISGFGKWNVRSKRPRRGRNPKTGEHIMLDARKVVSWRHSPLVKEAVNETGNGSQR